jgi:peptide chain release factor 2
MRHRHLLTALPRSWGGFDLPTKADRVAVLDKESSAPGFWDDNRAAQKKLIEVARLRDEVESWQALEYGTASVKELAELAIEEGDNSMQESLQAELEETEAKFEALEFTTRLSGEFDEKNALIALKQGAGGVDSQDWTEMLMRMYMRWAEKRGYGLDIVESTPGDGAGIKSATLQITGRYAYGFLRSEKGTHRLVRQSPFDADHQRHTSFALVEVLPEIKDGGEIILNPDDIEMEAFRASGHGGQNVQKNSTAVRLTHIPTGIVVSVQNERSQNQNKQIAMTILLSRVTELEAQKRMEETARLKGEHISPDFGGKHIRSYVVHPYHMIKDHRSDYETADTSGVLDGDIQEMLEAYLTSTAGD